MTPRQCCCPRVLSEVLRETTRSRAAAARTDEEEIPRRNRKLECSRRGRRCAAPVPRLFLIFHISGSCGESGAQFHYDGGGCWPWLSACARVNDRPTSLAFRQIALRDGAARCGHTHCCQRRHIRTTLATLVTYRHVYVCYPLNKLIGYHYTILLVYF